MAIITPTCPNSKMEKPLKPASCIIPSTTRFVEVPINVQIPPRIVAYERGIRNFAGGSFIRLAQFLMIGAKITTTGVLFRKAEMKAMTGRTRRLVPATVDFFCGNMAKIKRSNTPLLRIPSLTRNKRATVIMPLFEKPSNTSLGVSIPAQKNRMTTEKSIMPGRIRS